MSDRSQDSAEDWTRLGVRVRAQRDALKLTQEDVQALGGPCTATLRRIENGHAKTLSRSKRRDLERALRWPPGRVDAILTGSRRPRLPRPARGAIFTAAVGHRWREALVLIAGDGCTQPSRTCCCLAPGLPRGDWCLPCIAHHALSPDDRDFGVQQ